MPRVIETTVYEFAELSQAAKSKARDWYREASVQDEWWDAVYDDFERVCDILGVDLKTRGSGTRQKPCIYFSGFSSQGDGACFEARVSYAKGMVAKIKEYAPLDLKLHAIAEMMFEAQRKHFYLLTADVTHQGRYCHEYTMSISEDLLVEPMRDLARWLYRSLEAEHDYQTSDDAVEESIEANEYTFTKTGRRFA